MNHQALGLRVAGLIFLLVAVLHVVRVVEQFEIRIAGREIPMWVSPLAAVIFGGLGIWFWVLAKKGPRM